MDNEQRQQQGEQHEIVVGPLVTAISVRLLLDKLLEGNIVKFPAEDQELHPDGSIVDSDGNEAENPNVILIALQLQLAQQKTANIESE